MKKALAFATIAAVALLVGAMAGVALSAEEEYLDPDIVLSDMPLKVAEKKDLEGEHQANDVYIILVPYCEGTAI